MQANIRSAYAIDQILKLESVICILTSVPFLFRCEFFLERIVRVTFSFLFPLNCNFTLAEKKRKREKGERDLTGNKNEFVIRKDRKENMRGMKRERELRINDRNFVRFY